MSTNISPLQLNPDDVEPIRDPFEEVFSGEIGNVELPKSLASGVIFEHAKEVSHALELRPATVLMQAMAAVSAALSTSYKTEYRTGHAVPLGLYVVCEESPGAGKTHCQSLFFDDYNREIASINREISKQNNGKRDEEDTPRRPELLISLSDTTSAALSARLADAHSGRIVIVSSEQSTLDALFGGGGESKKSYSNDNGLLLSGYGGEWVSSARAGRNAYSGHVWGTVSIFAQPGSISRIMKESNGTGLIERFIPISEESVVGNRTHDKSWVTEVSRDRYRSMIQAAIKPCRGRALSDDIHESSLDDLIAVKPDGGGYGELRKLKINLEPKLGELNRNNELTMSQFISKSEQHILKFAAILYLGDELGVYGRVRNSTIPVDYIRKGIDLFSALAKHYHQILKAGGEDGEIAEVNAVMEYFGRKNRPEEIGRAAQGLSNCSPFKGMRKGGYKAAKRRIEEMRHKGIIHSSSDSEGKVVLMI